VSDAILFILRISAVLLAGGLVGWLGRSWSAEARHRVWLATLIGTLATGLLSPLATHLGFQLEPAYLWTTGPSATSSLIDGPVGLWLLSAWALGFLVFGARLGWGIADARRVTGRARVVTDPLWLACLRAAAHDLSLKDSVQLRQTGETMLPASWGILRPVILLPLEADSWSEERRRAVLLHELAHVRRRDCLAEPLAALTCAVYWFHPGVWWVARRLRLTREQSCDSIVLDAGTPAAEYAGHLVSLLRAACDARRAVQLVVSLAGRSPLEQRLLSLTRTPPGASRSRPLAAFSPLLLSLVLTLWNPIEPVPTPSVASGQRHGVSRCECIRRRLAAQERARS
jgi:beta-lactamase regulating signal transducer with metallopeptidase domain